MNFEGKSQPPESHDKSESFKQILKKIQDVEIGSERSGNYDGRVAQFKSLWEDIKTVSDPGEQAILEGEYDKHAGKMWEKLIDYLERLSMGAPPSDHGFYYDPAVAELREFPFASEDVRTRLVQDLALVNRYI